MKGRTQYNLRLVTVTNVPGQGTKNIIFLFSTAKRAKNWVHFVKIAQDNIGLGSISYGVKTLVIFFNCSNVNNFHSSKPSI